METLELVLSMLRREVAFPILQCACTMLEMRKEGYVGPEGFISSILLLLPVLDTPRQPYSNQIYTKGIHIYPKLNVGFHAGAISYPL